MLVRLSVPMFAYEEGPIVFVGHQRPRDFKKGSQAFSRILERQCELIFMATDDLFFEWCEEKTIRL